MRFKLLLVATFFICSLLPVISFSQNKVVVIPLKIQTPSAEFYSWDYSCAGIPDGGGYFSAGAILPDSVGVVKKLEVVIFITHTFNGDLDVTLLHANSGRIVELFTDIGGDGQNIHVHLDDEAETDIGTVPDGKVTGRFNPEGKATLATFNGIDASGYWYLRVADDAFSDVGTLNSFGLYIVD